MTANSNDLALETLLAVRSEHAPDLDEQLIRSCYEIQKKHQFDKDRTAASKAMEALVEERVKALSGDRSANS